MKPRLAATLFLMLFVCCAYAQQPSAPQGLSVDEWIDNFDAPVLDPANWEKFSFEGPSGANVELKDGIMCMRGVENARAGLRTTKEFRSDRFIVEATVAGLPKAFNQPTGFASLTLLFDTAGRNRIEWIFRSDGLLEAWYVKDGRGERLDNKRMGTKETSPTLGIVRRGDTLMFMLNGEVGLQKTRADMPRDLHVMLYGWGHSESNWNAIRIVTTK